MMIMWNSFKVLKDEAREILFQYLKNKDRVELKHRSIYKLLGYLISILIIYLIYKVVESIIEPSIVFILDLIR